MNYVLSYQKTEGVLHLIFWVFIFSAVNVSWQQDWFDTSIRTNTPSPLSVLIFPLLFYAHAYWAIPKYLVKRKWLLYGLSLVLIFVGPELIRLFFYALVLNHPPELEISSRDSFIFGTPSFASLAFMFSLVYRLFVDRVFPENLRQSAVQKVEHRTIVPTALTPEESQKLVEDITLLMNEKKLFLLDDLKLATVSEHLGISEKNLSALLNQYMRTSFTDYVNGYRIDYFVKEIEKGKLQQLSISGLMKDCGFSSKATFYRAFKKVKGCTPTEWLDTN